MKDRPKNERYQKILKILAVIFIIDAILFVFLTTESPVVATAYHPEPAMELEGALAVNEDLRSTEILAEGELIGPEDVAVDSEGRIYGGTEDGKIVRLQSDGSGLEVFAETGGRPLGLHFDAAGNLLVADAAKGLLSVDTEGAVTLLTDSAEDLPFKFTDDLDIASDGRVYFSDASHLHDHHHYLYDLLESEPRGRLLRWDPATAETEMLLDELYFANGIALSQDESFVLINETYRYRIRRYWLAGPNAGTSDIFIDRLPGFPDGVSANRRGTFWVALFTVRNPLMDRMHPYPFAKESVAKLPKALWPKPEPYGLVLALDENGQVVRSLHDPGGKTVQQITSVEEVDGHLYLGTLHQEWMGRLKH